MWLGATGYEDTHKQLVLMDGVNEEPQNVLLHFIVFAFIKTIYDEDRSDFGRWYLLQRFHDQPLELKLFFLGDNEFIRLDSMLNRKTESRH
jgi:hypothetical protein